MFQLSSRQLTTTTESHGFPTMSILGHWQPPCSCRHGGKLTSRYGRSTLTGQQCRKRAGCPDWPLPTAERGKRLRSEQRSEGWGEDCLNHERQGPEPAVQGGPDMQL